MPKAILCLSDTLKSEVAKTFEKQGALTNEVKEFIDDLPSCPVGIDIMLEEVSAKRKKRKPSEYNKFISECMRKAKIRETGKKASDVMKACALEWKKRKEG